MKLVTFHRKDTDREEVAVWRPGRGLIPAAALGYDFADMNDLIERASDADLAALGASDGPYIPEPDAVLLSPIPRPRQDVLCLGLNYADHAAEASGFSDAFTGGRERAVYFSKRAAYSQGTGAPIPAHADLTAQLDYEAELAVVLRRDARDVSEAEAEDCIFGYTILNDVTAREVQTAHKQWYFGKSLDGFAPMGPCIVTRDELAFPPRLRIWTTVNGELRQDSSTGLLIHGVAEIISELSRGMTLRAGTIIATGTPKGVAMGMDPPRFLRAGDTVVCGIEGIGTLENTVL